MTPDMMLAGVASLIFVAALIAALTKSGESRVPNGREASEGGSGESDPAKSKRYVDRRN